MTTRHAPPGRGPQATAGSHPPRSRRRRRWMLPGAVLVAGLAAVTLFWFQPQKLLYDQRVDEPLPSAAPSPNSGSARAPVELASGRFIAREHPTRGAARILSLPD